MIISQSTTSVILDKSQILVKGFSPSINNSFESLFAGFVDWLIFHNENDWINGYFEGNRLKIEITLPFSSFATAVLSSPNVIFLQ